MTRQQAFEHGQRVRALLQHALETEESDASDGESQRAWDELHTYKSAVVAMLATADDATDLAYCNGRDGFDLEARQ